jgi:hypothetical protein
MNLREIRTQIEYELQFAPSAEQHRIDVLASINRALVEILLMSRWTFRYRTYRLATFADITWNFDDWIITQAGTPVRHIRVTDLASELFSTNVNRRRGAQFIAAMHNNPVTPPETLRVNLGLGDQGWGTDQFIVERVEMSVTQTTIPDGFELYLDPRFALGSNPKDANWTGDWLLQFLRYALPRDCAQVERVTLLEGDNVSRQVLEAWDAAREVRILDLDPADTGQPGLWSVDVVGVGHTPGATFDLVGAAGYPHQVISGGARANGPEAPTGLTAAVVDVTGDWVAAAFNKRLTYCYTWVFAGMESGPSPTAEATINQVDDSVLLTLETLNDADFGRCRHIYRRIAEGPWRLITTLTDPSVTTYTDGGGQAVEPLIGEALDPTQLDYNLRETPSYQWLRLWPRPEQTTDVEVRYLARPKKLVHDHDVPEMPDECHMLVVHKVTAGLAARRGGTDLAKHHAIRFEEVLGAMQRRYLSTDDGPRTRGSSWDGRQRPFIYDVNWEGDT